MPQFIIPYPSRLLTLGFYCCSLVAFVSAALISSSLLAADHLASGHGLGEQKYVKTPKQNVTLLVEDALRQKLHEQDYWLKLGHYRYKALYFKYVSEVDDAKFFLSKSGRNNPKEELIATIHGLFGELDQSNDSADQVSSSVSPNEIQATDLSQVQCRFISRYEWLSNVLNQPLPNVLELCPDYRDWRKEVSVESVILAFPASYLNSPSSMFGHTLIRLDPPDKQSKLLSHALNFAAQTNNEDGELFFAFKGLLGGYPGYFSLPQYHKKVKNYGRIENRDIWEYKLNLSPAEIDRMMAHVWELKEIRFDYFFFDENCSYRLLTLLEVARPGAELIGKFGVRAIPADTVKEVLNNGFVESVNYRPSIEAELRQMTAKLSEEEKDLAIALIENTDLLDSEAFQARPAQKQSLMALVAYRHIRYAALRKSHRDADLNKAAHQLLLFRSQLDVDDVIDTVPPPRPESGHDTRTLTLEAGSINSSDFATFSFRPAYHQLLDNNLGYDKGAAINFLDSTWRKRENQDFELADFTVLEIESFSPVSGFIKPLSWQVDFAVRRLESSTNTDLRWQLNVGAGRTFAIDVLGDVLGNAGISSLFYALAIVGLERHHEHEHSFGLSAGPRIGLLSYFPRAVWQLEATYHDFVNSVPSRYAASSQLNVQVSRNNSVRFSNEYWKSDSTKSVKKHSLAWVHHF